MLARMLPAHLLWCTVPPVVQDNCLLPSSVFEPGGTEAHLHDRLVMVVARRVAPRLAAHAEFRQDLLVKVA